MELEKLRAEKETKEAESSDNIKELEKELVDVRKKHEAEIQAKEGTLLELEKKNAQLCNELENAKLQLKQDGKSKGSGASHGGEEESSTRREPQLRQTIKLKKKATYKNGRLKKAQGHCRIKGCIHESTYVCDLCTHDTDPNARQCWICLDPSRGCFAQHKREKHNMK